ncbi:MAG: hypothetical protein O7A09_11665 [Proteobacteria bacterium]|nr:hypothetical protein [Pseudomonadota bacterium]
MLSTRNQLLATLALAVPFAAPVAVADDGPVTVDDHFEVDGTCEPPISTCGGPVILSAEEAVRPEIWPPPPECPPGYACTCV